MVDMTNQSIIDREIPAIYLFHLHWMMQEAFPQGEPSRKELIRSMWLQNVLDVFVDEIKAVEVTPDWRSGVLNPILVRALHAVDDFNQREILRAAQKECQLSGKTMTIKHWEGFYLNLDVVAPTHHLWWCMIKRIRPMSCRGCDVDDASHGNVISSDMSAKDLRCVVTIL